MKSLTYSSLTGNECLICCEEIISNSQQNLYTIYNKCIIIKPCDCNPNVHSKCLHNWIETSFTCPICRSDYKKRFACLNVPILIYFSFIIVTISLLFILIKVHFIDQQ